MEVVGRWGTWEELLLGGAVLRYGTQSWDVVSSQLRARITTPYLSSFTPQVCKAKYEDLQQQYSGCTAWFEELRKKRVNQLKQELLKSEESIGSLESKLEVLKSQSRETSKDGLSAGSFTQEIKNINWQPIIIHPKIKQQILLPKEVRGTPTRKRRGKRKRKDDNVESVDGFTSESANLASSCIILVTSATNNDDQEQPKIEAKNNGIVHKKMRRRRKDSSSSTTKKPVVEVCDGHSGNLSSTHNKEKPTSNHDHNRDNHSISMAGNTQLLTIFNTLATTPNALVFRHRLDSQKRARYRRIVRQHVDFDTIRTRISNKSTTSVQELFRDLLLLANNALAFYSRRTREYKSALSLRDTITKEYNKHHNSCDHVGPSNNNIVASSIFPLCNRPVKPRSLRPFQRKPTTNAPGFGDNNVGGLSEKIRDNKEELVVLGNPEECRRPSSSSTRGGGKAGPTKNVGRKSEEMLGPVIKLKRKTSCPLPKTPTKGARRGRRR